MFARNSGSDHRPRTAAPSGFPRSISSMSRAVSVRAFSGYISAPSVSLSHHVYPRKLLVTVVPGWWWQTTHWLDGIVLVKTCLIGWPDSSRAMVGSAVAGRPRLPYFAYAAECTGARSFALITWQAR